MAAPIGNQFWKKRSKHGRGKLFKTPELLWEAACEYFKEVDENPIERNDFKGKDAEEVIYKLQRPYTIQGLCLYLDCGVNYFNQFEGNLDPKKRPEDKDFSLITTRIRQIIYYQKFDGAAAGIFNSSIIARDLGLADKSELKASVSTPILSNDPLNGGDQADNSTTEDK